MGTRLWLQGRSGPQSKPGDIISSTVLDSRLGPVRQTYAGTKEFPPIARAYTEVSQTARETGLLRRTPWFYGTVGLAIALAFGGAITGFILLGDSWFQL